MFWAAPSPVMVDVRSVIALNHGQAGVSDSIGTFPTVFPRRPYPSGAM